MQNTTLKNILFWIIKIGLFIIPFIPLYIAGGMVYPYITGKAFAFRIIVEIVFFLWVFLAIFYKEYRPRKNYLLIAIAVFVFVVTLATIFGINPARSFWSNFERMEGLLAYFHIFAYFLVLGSVFKKIDWTIFFNIFIVAGFVENFYVLFQKLGYILSLQGGPSRPDGTIGNPTYVATYLIFVVAFSVILLILSKNKLAKIYYGFSALFSLFAIYLTASRGPVLGILFGLVLAGLIYLLFKKSDIEREKSYKKIILWALILLLVIIGAIWFFRNSPFIQNNPTLSRLTSLSFSDRTITSRFTIWGIGFQGFKERPILGWGPENYPVVFAKYYKPELWLQEPWFDRSHNIIFDWLINAGILGLLSYLAIFAAAIYYLWKNYLKKSISFELGLTVIILFIAYFFQNLFVFDNLVTYIGFFAVLAFIYNVSTEEDRLNLNKILPAATKDIQILAGGSLIILLFLAIYFFNVRGIIINHSLMSALQGQRQYSTLKTAFDDFKKALSYNSSLGRQEVVDQLSRFGINVNSLEQVDGKFKAEILDRAIIEAKSFAADYPLDPRPNLLLGNLLMQQLKVNEAIEVFNKAINLSPKKQQIYFELADVYIKLGDYEKAKEVLETAFNLDRGFFQARLNLAAIYVLNGEQAKADALLIEQYGTTEVASNLLVQAYYNIKDYKRLIGVWSAYVKDAPNNVDYRRSLAGAYLLAGNKNQALNVLEEAIRLFPDFKQEGETYISQIKSGQLQ